MGLNNTKDPRLMKVYYYNALNWIVSCI